MQLILWNTKWQASRLKIIAQRMANEVTHLLDQGSTMAQAILVDCLYRMGSNVKSLGLIRQQLFLQRVANELPKSFKKVAKKLEAIRMCILRPENTTVHIGTCLPKMEFYLTDKPEVTDAIGQLLRRTFDYTGWQWGYETKRLANSPDYNVMKGVDCITKCVVERCLRMHSDEGSYLAQAAPCVNSYNDPEYPVVLTTMMYFCQVDGPFYKAVKATGFATAYHMKVKPNEGMVYFELKHCSDLVSAYCGAFDIIVSHLDEMDGRRPKEEAPLWNETLLETAKSSVIFELIENENTPFALSMKSLIDYYHEVPADFRTKVMERVTNVTMDEVKKITKKYLRALFVEVSSCAVAAPKEKVPRIIKGLME
jgi:Zn-dependent M16 (insulinase) family peptidase